MKTLTMIEMAGCPYCANAHRAINALKAEGGAYADVPVEYIDENAEPERTKPYAGMYYYGPSLFVGGEKYYEAQPGHDYETILAAVRVAFDTITKS